MLKKAFHILFGTFSDLTDQEQKLRGVVYGVLAALATVLVGLWVNSKLNAHVSADDGSMDWDNKAVASLALAKMIVFPIISLVALGVSIVEYKAASHFMSQLKKADGDLDIVKALIFIGICLINACIAARII